MAIIDHVLADFDLSSGENVRVEVNQDDSVHIHVDSVRINLSKAEYEELVATVRRANESLIARKG